MFVDELKSAFFRLVEKERRNLLSITRITGVNNSTLNRLYSNKAQFENIPAKTIERLFPHITVYFFPEDKPLGTMVNEKHLEESDFISLTALENRILHSDSLSAEEQVKFLLFLKEQTQ